MTQGILKESAALPAIETENHFVQISGEMLDAHFVPGSHDATLEQRECAFDSVRVDISNCVNRFVTDGFVGFPMGALKGKRIDGRFVCNNHFHVLTHIFIDDFADSFGRGFSSANQTQIATAHADADDYLLFFPWPIDARFPADVSFVDFHNSFEQFFMRFEHRRADAMAEIPRCFVAADSEDALHLERGDALLRFANQHSGEKPLGQREMRVIENRSGGDSELLLAVLAAENGFTATHPDDFFLPALRADRAIGPAQFFEVRPALAFAVETRNKFRKSHANIRHGDSPMKKKRKRVKSDREVLKGLFPPEIVREVDNIIAEVDAPRIRKRNPDRKAPKGQPQIHEAKEP